MLFHNVEQNTDEWMGLRRGKFTASSFKNLMMKDTTVTYKKELQRVAFERVTGKSPEFYVNDAMIRGHELEPEARSWYEVQANNFVDNGGFYELDEWVGASPDGIIDDGLLEIKCPLFNTHIEYLMNEKLPTEYKWQIQGQLYVCSAEWCDFISYHPDLKPLLLRVERDDKAIKKLEETLKVAIEKTQEIIERIK